VPYSPAQRVGDATVSAGFIPELNESTRRAAAFLYHIAADIKADVCCIDEDAIASRGQFELASMLIVDYGTALLDLHRGNAASRYVPVAVPVGTTYNGPSVMMTGR